MTGISQWGPPENQPDHRNCCGTTGVMWNTPEVGDRLLSGTLPVFLSLPFSRPRSTLTFFSFYLSYDSMIKMAGLIFNVLPKASSFLGTDLA